MGSNFAPSYANLYVVYIEQVCIFNENRNPLYQNILSNILDSSITFSAFLKGLKQNLMNLLAHHYEPRFKILS